ncbi:fumarylacetoacetate hydrolase family protein [Nocardia sp. NEAU-G5]|uniref:Fumarylacetoacetate hydrolase family protein n=2 Tax=Nocardia albiluteola TaxID=2842303 RepID=A0ABS6AYQ6_9NOCA|nr:fumarylacetoacetate hydrolase family protein [Nocardia albiluteola]
MQAATDSEPPSPWLLAGQLAMPLREWAGDLPFAFATSVHELIARWPEHRRELHALTSAYSTRAAIAEFGIDFRTLRPQTPVQPRQVFCTIGNYRRQVAEAAADAGDPAGAEQRRAAALRALDRRHTPYICLTSSERVTAPVGTLTLPPQADTLDWEVEIAVVLGATAHNLSPADVPHVIAGYCVANDLTLRSSVFRDDVPVMGTDWIQSKGMPDSLPLGPWFVPAWQVPDPARLRLQLRVNGTLMQDDEATDMVFGIDQQIAYLSQHTRLRPGDVVCTGSPAGFGAHHGRFLHAGDVVTAHISGLGEQVHCIEQTPAGQPPATTRTSTKEQL